MTEQVEKGPHGNERDKTEINVRDWLNYFQAEKKRMADGNNINLVLFYVIGIFFVASLLVLLFLSGFMLVGMFGLGISIILLSLNCYTRFNTENVMLELDSISLKIMMGELTDSTTILNEMNKVFKKKK